ncbi:SMI1/KNR4 family protein [Chitinimonas viridis]|uniref:SMI1/KNR4 family protein n=1 Tax=Chitinimonas viridis TaxID=664880 RepID=A0ABT8B3P3_9NEIS|nr:SMI1/KNR4 family protein [Chitinimonas viridis]MDN3576281.1 SMI1/KNR4 family protein [Chitinimonas viridis]
MLSDAKALHADLVAPLLGSPVGASEEDVGALESRIGLKLPDTYRQYLVWMGRDVNGIFRGSNWFISDIESNREVLKDLLEEIGSQYELAPSHLVFFTHQGYMAAWFDASGNEVDPKCWFIHDGMQEPGMSGNFTEVLLADLKGLASCLPR